MPFLIYAFRRAPFLIQAGSFHFLHSFSSSFSNCACMSCANAEVRALCLGCSSALCLLKCFCALCLLGCPSAQAPFLQRLRQQVGYVRCMHAQGRAYKNTQYTHTNTHIHTGTHIHTHAPGHTTAQSPSPSVAHHSPIVTIRSPVM